MNKNVLGGLFLLGLTATAFALIAIVELAARYPKAAAVAGFFFVLSIAYAVSVVIANEFLEGEGKTSAALPGEHYCPAHQGNGSHYAEHNCRVCRLEKTQEK